MLRPSPVKESSCLTASSTQETKASNVQQKRRTCCSRDKNRPLLVALLVFVVFTVLMMPMHDVQNMSLHTTDEASRTINLFETMMDIVKPLIQHVTPPSDETDVTTNSRTETSPLASPRGQPRAALSTRAESSSSSNNNGINKTLVIIIGNLRGGEKAWKTLYDNVLDVNSADLALMIGETAPQHVNATLFERATYHWTFPEFEDWADALDLINGPAWRESVIPLMHKQASILGGVKKHKFKGSGAVIFMIRWFLSNKLKELNLITKYSRFVITRSDHYYLCHHDLSQLDNQFLWIPKGEDYRGITDRHLIVSADHVLAALDILPPLLQNPEPYAKILEDKWGNPEQVLARRWKEAGLGEAIKRFNRTMFTCGEPGDMTRWKKISGDAVPEGVQLKYKREYSASYATCGMS